MGVMDTGAQLKPVHTVRNGPPLVHAAAFIPIDLGRDIFSGVVGVAIRSGPLGAVAFEQPGPGVGILRSVDEQRAPRGKRSLPAEIGGYPVVHTWIKGQGGGAGALAAEGPYAVVVGLSAIPAAGRDGLVLAPATVGEGQLIGVVVAERRNPAGGTADLGGQHLALVLHLLAGHCAAAHRGQSALRLGDRAGQIGDVALIEVAGQVLLPGALAAVVQGHHGLSALQGAQALAVALQVGQHHLEGPLLVGGHAVVNEGDLNHLLVPVGIEHQGAAGGGVIRARNGGAVHGGVVNGEHGLVAAGAHNGQLRRTGGLVRPHVGDGKAQGARLGLVVVHHPEGQGVGGVVQGRAQVVHDGKGAELQSLGVLILGHGNPDLLHPLALGKGHVKDIAGIGVLGVLGGDAGVGRFRVQVHQLFRFPALSRGGLILLRGIGHAQVAVGAVLHAVHGVDAAEIVALQVLLGHHKVLIYSAVHNLPVASVQHIPLVGLRLHVDGQGDVGLRGGAHHLHRLLRLSGGLRPTDGLVLRARQGVLHLDDDVVGAGRRAVGGAAVLQLGQGRLIGDVGHGTARRAAQAVDLDDGGVAALLRHHLEVGKGKGAVGECGLPVLCHGHRVAVLVHNGQFLRLRGQIGHGLARQQAQRQRQRQHKRYAPLKRLSHGHFLLNTISSSPDLVPLSPSAWNPGAH